MNERAKARMSRDGVSVPTVRCASFQVVTFFDAELKKQILILYGLGEDGIIRELSGGKWTKFPILKEE